MSNSNPYKPTYAGMWMPPEYIPTARECTMDDFTDEQGYLESDRDAIAALDIGESFTLPSPFGGHRVTRIG